MKPSSRTAAAFYAALSLLTPAAALLTPEFFLPAQARADDPAAASADDAVTARYHVEKLVYDKQAAERTIKGSETNLQQSAKSMLMLKETIEKRRKELEAAREALKRATAEQAMQTAEQLAKKLENDHRRDNEQLKRFEERNTKLEADIAAARKKIPELDRELVAARPAADEARTRAVEADRRRAAGQDPQSAARRIDELIDARLKSRGIPASPQVDDAEFLRRATLDVTGVVPKYEEVIAFLDEKSPDKRAVVVDHLLSDARPRSIGRSTSITRRKSPSAIGR